MVQYASETRSGSERAPEQGRLDSVGVFGVVALVAIAAGALAALWLFVQHVASVPVPHLTRDPTAVAGSPWYVGSVSTMGIALWVGSGMGALVASSSPAMDREAQSFLRWFGVLAIILAVDDGLLVHEVVGVELLGTWAEKALLVLYGVVAIIGVVVHRRKVMECPILLCAFVCLGLSIVIDVLDLKPAALGLAPVSIEDYFKVLGIILWTVGLLAKAVRELRNPIAT